jgi:hypothetical protein
MAYRALAIFPRLRAESLTSRIELLLVNSGIHLCRLAVSMLIGCIVALACKRREMLATDFDTLIWPTNDHLIWPTS